MIGCVHDERPQANISARLTHLQVGAILCDEQRVSRANWWGRPSGFPTCVHLGRPPTRCTAFLGVGFSRLPRDHVRVALHVVLRVVLRDNVRVVLRDNVCASRASRSTPAPSCALPYATMCAPPAPHVCAQQRALFSSFVSVIFLLSLFCLYSSLISSFPRLTPSFFRIFMEPSCVFLWCSTSTQRFLKIQPKQITLGDKKAIR